MRVVFIGQNDWANCANRAARALNAHYKEKVARVLTLNEHPFGYEEDILISKEPKGLGGALQIVQEHLTGAKPNEPTWVFTTGDGSGFSYIGLKRIASKYKGTLHIGTAYRQNSGLLDGWDKEHEVTCRFISADSFHLITSPDSSRDYPYIHSVDIEKSQGLREPSKPLVVHSPSSRASKGTHTILEALDELSDQGFSFDRVLVEGLDYQACLKQREKGDIFIGQFNEAIGGYGYSEIEAMAQGMAVISSTHNVDLDCWTNTKVTRSPPIVRGFPYSALVGELAKMLGKSDYLVEARKDGLRWIEENATPKAAGAIYADVLERRSSK